jgi:hypothetical protein
VSPLGYCNTRALTGAVFLIARVPQYPHDRGYAASRELAMGDFKARWTA